MLLDDANSYWWLVRVLKTEDVGYIPAENVETPYERLARLNKHRNIDIAAATSEDKAALPDVPVKESKLKSLIGWKRSPQLQETSFDDDDDPETRANRRVVFAPPTFFEHPGVTWSDDEEDEEDDDETHIIDGGEPASSSHEVDDEDVHDQINVDHELGFEVEPDDGVEWAQDAVEAQRNAAQVTVVDTSAPLAVPAEVAAAAAASPTASMSVFDTSLDVSSDAHGSLVSDIPSTTETAQFGTATVVAGVAGAAAGAAGLAALGSHHLGQTNVNQHPPAPDRSPSPSVSHSALARTNPTPPPHRAPFTPSPIASASPDYNPNQSFTETTETLASPSAAHAPSSDLHAPSASGQVAPSSTAPSTPPRSSSLGRSGSLQSPRSSNLTSPPPLRPPRRATMRYQDAFDIARLNTIVHARAKELKRTTPVPNRRAAPQIDAVQRVYYGEKAEMDNIHPDIRACFVHVLAKMDTFDREIDEILGSLVPAH